MIQKVLDYMKEHNLIEERDHIVVAVSGGADSVCMLLLLEELAKRLCFTLEAVTVEHGIRGEDSCRDADFVEAICKQHGIAFTKYSVDVLSYAQKNRLGVEESARLLRYDVFTKHSQAVQRPCKIALAHHMDDNAETVLFQMIRGSFLSGLKGIQPVSVKNGNRYIRPLLCVSRKEIETFLKQKEQDYCVDVTNMDVAYSRNRIRHVILPELCRINEQASLHIHKEAEAIAMVCDYLKEQEETVAYEVLRERENEVTIDISKLQNLHPYMQRQVMRRAIVTMAKQEKDIEARHVEILLDLVNKQSGKQVDLPYHLRALREYDTIRLLPRKTTSMDESNVDITKQELQELYQSGQTRFLIWGGQEGSFEIAVKDYVGEKVEKKPYTKIFDYDMIENGFRIRTRKSGDYLIADECGHRKKLQNYFTDEKIPKECRDRIPIVVNGQEVIWVVGGRIGENYKIKTSTKKLVVIKYNGGKNDAKTHF